MSTLARVSRQDMMVEDAPGVIINGTTGNDVIDGTQADDTINGGGVQGLSEDTVAVSEANNLGRAVLAGIGCDDAPTPGMIDMASLAFVAPMIAPEFYG